LCNHRRWLFYSFLKLSENLKNKKLTASERKTFAGEASKLLAGFTKAKRRKSGGRQNAKHTKVPMAPEWNQQTEAQ